MIDQKLKALSLEYRAFRAVALWFDVGTTVSALMGWVALALAIAHHGAWGVILAIVSILMSVRFQSGLREKFEIIKVCVKSILSLLGSVTDEGPLMFQHDHGKVNDPFRRFGDVVFFGASYLAAVVAIFIVVLR